MEPIRVFVASSSEAEPIAKQVRLRLQQELGSDGVVELWRTQFEPGETTIESLERVAEEVDCAALVLTPDDVSVSRHIARLAPRDNLVFELGLFLGALGRERSIVVRDAKSKLKLPSDYVGVTALTYQGSTPDDVSTSLKTACLTLAEHIRKAGPRPKWLAQGRAALAALGSFGRDVEGMWWERIRHETGTALSSFAIATDPSTGSLTFDGAGYGPNGDLASEWKSDLTRSYPPERKIAYLWRGKREDQANLKYH